MSKLIGSDTKTFVKFWSIPVIIALVLLFITKASTGLIVIGASIFLAIALKPLVEKVDNFFSNHFGKKAERRTSSAVLAYILVVAVIGGILAAIGPVVVSQTSRFIEQVPDMFEKSFGGWEGINGFGRTIGIADLHAEIVNGLDHLSKDIIGVFSTNLISGVSGLADVIMKVVLVLILTLLFLLEGPKMMAGFWRGVSSGETNKKPATVARRVVSRMANVISTYVSRQLLVAVIDGVASGLIVFILSLFTEVPSSLAIPMGLITMIFYLIPMFGQFIGGTLVTIILLSNSVLAGVIFAVIYIVYAQIENNVIAPKIQGNALSLPAVAILCAVTIGMYMFGLPGAIIAVPIAGCIRVLIDEYPNIKMANRQ